MLLVVVVGLTCVGVWQYLQERNLQSFVLVSLMLLSSLFPMCPKSPTSVASVKMLGAGAVACVNRYQKCMSDAQA